MDILNTPTLTTPMAAEQQARQSRTLVACSAVACTLFLVGLWQDWFWVRLAAKPIPHLALLIWLARTPRSRFASWVSAALAVCLVADAMLEFRHRMFLPGLVGFLVGHLLLIAAFLHRSRQVRILRALPFVAWGVFSYVQLRPTLGKLALPVAMYTAAICIMMWRAAACIETTSDGPVGAAAESLGRRASRWLALGGAVSFAIGDTLIAFDRFHAPIAGVRYPIILTYWLAIWCIAGSARLEQESPLARSVGN